MKILKLIVVIVLVAAIAVAGAVIGVELKNDEADTDMDVLAELDEAMFAEVYPDYKTEVYLDKGDDPDLNELGLFWCRYDPVTHDVEWVPADTAEGAALVDTSKPTVINVHGMMMDGYINTEKYYVNTDIGNLEELGLDEEDGWDYDTLRTLALWLEKGWNVGVYNWHRFTAESVNFTAIEAKVWATNGSANVRWCSSDGRYHNDPIEYSVAELFVGDYLRAVELLPDDYGKEEIRFTGHSMGGELVSAAAFLLYEISTGDSPQISADKLPDRMTMDDTFFGAFLEVGDLVLDMAERGLTVRWSGKPMPGDRAGRAVVEALRYLSVKGVVIDYYSYDGSPLHLALNAEDRGLLLDSVAYVLMDPLYNAPGYGDYTKSISEAHVAVRQYSQVSIMRDYPGGNLTDAEKIAYADALPTAEMRSLTGKAFRMTAGASTVTTADDVYVEVSHEEIIERFSLA